MIEEIYEFLLELLIWVVTSLGLGVTFTFSLYGILDAMGIDYNNHKQGKVRCWAYVSLFVFGLCLLMHVLGQ